VVEVCSVAVGSRAESAGIRPGDFILSINGNKINDVLDYRYYLAEKRIRVELHRGEEILSVDIEKPVYDDIGLEFETYLMDKKRSFRNKCIFCFIDQLPRGMREPLYFKDDDSRLSFLTGSYVTLTNMSDEDIERIIKMKMSPINISVHTANPELRVQMLKNRRAGEVMDVMRRFAENGIVMNCQIVLCRGINDGDELIYTMNELEKLHPAVASVSVVPSGLTKFREKLYPLTPYTPEECGEIIDLVESVAARCREKYDVGLFYCGDEMYIKSGRELPDEPHYDGYPQIENGVGMIRSMKEEFEFAAEDLSGFDLSRKRKISIATGEAAHSFIVSLADALKAAVPSFECSVYEIKNDFFGENITVAGLITGQDLYNQLKGKDLGERLYLPSVMLRSDGEVFLDDMTPSELEEKLGVEIFFVKNDGYEFVEALLG